MITLDECRGWFEYDQENGGLIRRASAPFKLRWVVMASGYIHTNVRGKTHYAHRLVFLWHHGFIPSVVDHIDGDKGNNRIENLRAATHTQNKYNVPMRRNNTTGAKGVVFHPKCTRKPYQAKIAKHGRVFSFGYYATVEEAAKAYEAGAKRIAGEFARADIRKEVK